MRKLALRDDRAAVIDVPMKMLVSVVIVSMATMVLYPALQSYQESEMENRLGLSMAELEAAVLAVHRHPGSSRTVLVDVPSSGGIRLDSLTIGGDLTDPPSQVGTLRWSLSTGAHGTHLVSTAAGPVPMADADGSALVIDSFPCLVALEAMTSPPGSHYGTFVQATVL